MELMERAFQRMDRFGKAGRPVVWRTVEVLRAEGLRDMWLGDVGDRRWEIGSFGCSVFL